MSTSDQLSASKQASRLNVYAALGKRFLEMVKTTGECEGASLCSMQ